MAYAFYNPNPIGRFTNDCTVRAVSKALDIDWDTASVLLCNSAIQMGDIEPSNQVLAAVLRQHGFYRAVIDNDCPDCYTAEDFCNEHFKGTYVLGFGDHVCCVVDGVIFDTFDSSSWCPIYYWYQHN
jgi:hypothetical protein